MSRVTHSSFTTLYMLASPVVLFLAPTLFITVSISCALVCILRYMSVALNCMELCG